MRVDGKLHKRDLVKRSGVGITASNSGRSCPTAVSFAARGGALGARDQCPWWHVRARGTVQVLPGSPHPGSTTAVTRRPRSRPCRNCRRARNRPDATFRQQCPAEMQAPGASRHGTQSIGWPSISTSGHPIGLVSISDTDMHLQGSVFPWKWPPGAVPGLPEGARPEPGCPAVCRLLGSGTRPPSRSPPPTAAEAGGTELVSCARRYRERPAWRPVRPVPGRFDGPGRDRLRGSFDADADAAVARPPWPVAGAVPDHA